MYLGAYGVARYGHPRPAGFSHALSQPCRLPPGSIGFHRHPVNLPSVHHGEVEPLQIVCGRYLSEVLGYKWCILLGPRSVMAGALVDPVLLLHVPLSEDSRVLPFSVVMNSLKELRPNTSPFADLTIVWRLLSACSKELLKLLSNFRTSTILQLKYVMTMMGLPSRVNVCSSMPSSEV